MTETPLIKGEIRERREGERRGKRRFRIDLSLQCRVLDRRTVVETSLGRTVDISSSGVSIRTQAHLHHGDRVALSLGWPVLVNETCPVNLVIEGTVVRYTADGAVIAIVSHEFRTRGTNSGTSVIPVLSGVLKSVGGAAASGARREPQGTQV